MCAYEEEYSVHTLAYVWFIRGWWWSHLRAMAAADCSRAATITGATRRHWPRFMRDLWREGGFIEGNPYSADEQCLCYSSQAADTYTYQCLRVSQHALVNYVCGCLPQVYKVWWSCAPSPVSLAQEENPPGVRWAWVLFDFISTTRILWSVLGSLTRLIEQMFDIVWSYLGKSPVITG